MLALILKLTVSFFAVMNPLGNIPIFITLTNAYSLQERRNSARKAVIISFIILTLFLLLGGFIFSMFGITIHAFRVAGGILIFGIAYVCCMLDHRMHKALIRMSKKLQLLKMIFRLLLLLFQLWLDPEPLQQSCLIAHIQ